MASSNDQLSNDLFFEIISRTPSLRTLDACKTVCKEWKQLVNETNFLPLYCHRTKNVSGFFVQDLSFCKYVSEFVSFDEEGGRSTSSSVFGKFPPNTRILASCKQGILVCVRKTGRMDRYYVCKPATGQWRPLPNPRRHDATRAVAITVLRSTPTLHYKIVRLSNLRSEEAMKGCTALKCDIFDSKTWKWRIILNINLPYCKFITKSSFPSTTVANSIYWLTTSDNVIEFREADESFDKFPLPKLMHNDHTYNCKQLVEYQGGLGFVCTRDDDHFELWVRELDLMSEVMVWRMEMEVDVSRVYEHAFLVGFYNAGFAFLSEYRGVVFYRLQDSNVTRVKLNQPRVAHEVFSFRSDFEVIDL